MAACKNRPPSSLVTLRAQWAAESRKRLLPRVDAIFALFADFPSSEMLDPVGLPFDISPSAQLDKLEEELGVQEAQLLSSVLGYLESQETTLDVSIDRLFLRTRPTFTSFHPPIATPSSLISRGPAPKSGPLLSRALTESESIPTASIGSRRTSIRSHTSISSDTSFFTASFGTRNSMRSHASVVSSGSFLTAPSILKSNSMRSHASLISNDSFTTAPVGSKRNSMMSHASIFSNDSFLTAPNTRRVSIISYESTASNEHYVTAYPESRISVGSDSFVTSNESVLTPRASDFNKPMAALVESKPEATLGIKQRDSEFSKLLVEKKLWPIDPLIEQDWSGRGQHAEFKRHEQHLLDSILHAEEVLGSSGSAVVQKVRCRRICLARKTIRCHRGFPKRQAIDEVAHLERVTHGHVVRVIGTYSMGNDLSILLYPATEYNLETFIQSLDRVELRDYEWRTRLYALNSFCSCLVRTLAYLHGRMVKHMDIKPRNILVRSVRHRSGFRTFKVYIADFGIARSYSSLADSETEGPTSFTRKYAAPEVWDDEKPKRGLPVDVFSLGCVLLEIVAALSPLEHDMNDFFLSQDAYLTWRRSVFGLHADPSTALQALLKQGKEGNSYQANIPAVREFAAKWTDANVLVVLKTKPICKIIMSALDRDPSKRPTAAAMVAILDQHQIPVENCCWDSSPEPLEAARPLRDDDEDEEVVSS